MMAFQYAGRTLNLEEESPTLKNLGEHRFADWLDCYRSVESSGAWDGRG